MIEVIWHGRGGQGAFTAARLLGAAATYQEGLHSLAFPTFGPERRGAPIRAFTKISTSPIGNRSEVKQADYVVYLDETLFDDNWEEELKASGRVLLNTKNSHRNKRVTCIDASGIAEEVLGRDIPNTVFLALICNISDTLSPKLAKFAIQDYMPEKLISKNLDIVDYVNAGIPSQVRASQTTSDLTHPRSSLPNNLAEARRNYDIAIPKLNTEAPKPIVFAHNTCWKAGFLTTKNAGWRTSKPVVRTENCTGCLKCYMDCPDGCIFKIDNKKVAIDYDFCKGCGICAKTCKFEAIGMFAERGKN